MGMTKDISNTQRHNVLLIGCIRQQFCLFVCLFFFRACAKARKSVLIASFVARFIVFLLPRILGKYMYYNIIPAYNLLLV